MTGIIFGTTFPLCTIIVLLFVGQVQCQNVEIIEVDPIPSQDVFLIESPKTYPSVNVDIFWKISENVDVKILNFGIDAQSGDYVLLSKYPLPDLPPGQIIRNLPVSEYILLSSGIASETTYRLVNPQGVFIYFHGEYNEDRSSVQSGFKIEITPFDKPEPIMSTTTESSVTPPAPGTDVYVKRIITGKTPYKFIQDLDIFKDLIATMTNKYLDEEQIGTPRPAVGDDVVIPIGEILFCDRAWPVFKTCVEVTFAINVYDNEGKYVMTKPRIDEMWDSFSSDLNDKGYASYTEPEASEKAVAWIWVAGSLGTLLVFSVVLCFAWYKKANARFNELKIIEVVDEIRGEGGRHYDTKTPIRTVLKTMTTNGSRRNGDYENELVYRGQSEGGNRSSFGGLPGMNGNTYRDNQAFGLHLDAEDEDVDEFNITKDDHENYNYDNDFLSPRLRQARLSEVPSEFEAEH